MYYEVLLHYPKGFKPKRPNHRPKCLELKNGQSNLLSRSSQLVQGRELLTTYLNSSD